MKFAMGRDVFTAAALAVALLFTGSARADEPRVEVLTEVVLVSNEGTAVDPPKLARLKDELAAQGKKFSSLKRLSEKKVAVQKGKPADVALPDGRTATLKLVDIKDGAASITVTVPQKKAGAQPLTATYQAGPNPLTVYAGEFQNGKLLLILSPPESGKPRTAAGGVNRRHLLPLHRGPARAPAPADAPTTASSATQSK